VRVGLAAVFLAVLTGCARPEPFVYKESEFDRRNIARSAPVPGVVQICYHGPATTAEAVLRLAEEECAKFGKAPQMIGQEIYACPMTTPVAAHYLCCPTDVDPNLRYRCSATGGQVERLNNEQVREILAAQRRGQSQSKR
jgi:hypothetical protein